MPILLHINRLHKLLENAMLAFEVPVDGGACQADGGADLIDADVLVSQFLKEVGCGPRNLLGASAPTCR